MPRLATLLAVCALTLFACDHRSSAAPEGEGAQPAQQQEEQKVYICPMHCVPEGQTEEYTSNAPGRCPVCGMNLVEKE